MQKVLAGAIIFMLGGIGYGILEILWRGYSHWTMVLTGGVCFLLLYAIHTRIPLSLPWRMLLGCAAITSCEFAVGCTVNLWLGWDVWDYADLPGNLLGQICPHYCLVWLALTAASAPLCRRLSILLETENSPDTLANGVSDVYNRENGGNGREHRGEEADRASL